MNAWILGSCLILFHCALGIEDRSYTYSDRPSSNEAKCTDKFCRLRSGNLMIGRTSPKYLRASSTCGTNGTKSMYCVILNKRCGSLEGTSERCYICENNAHNISNVLKSNYEYERRRKRDTEAACEPTYATWWQSDNGIHNVWIQFDLHAEFYLSHITILFKTFLPAAMLIERRRGPPDSWNVLRYYAEDCISSFPGVSTKLPSKVEDIVCHNKYSKSIYRPSYLGQFQFRPFPPYSNPSELEIDTFEYQDYLRFNSLRINFTKLHTFGDELLTKRNEILNKYHYAIYELSVYGMCSCYGHADKCQLGKIDVDDYQVAVNKEDGVVYSVCNCLHNTDGKNCEKCKPLYNDLQWEPAISKVFECQKCECHGHADSCKFTPEIYAENMAKYNKSSGGSCNCYKNYTGNNCHMCSLGFYFQYEYPDDFRRHDACVECNCGTGSRVIDAPRGGDQTDVIQYVCQHQTERDIQGNILKRAGQCECKENVEGYHCDICKDGYWNLTLDNPLGCEKCTCAKEGTVENKGCNKVTGKCDCKRNVIGKNCDQCKENTYGLSDREDGCAECDCHSGGSREVDCNTSTGQCNCRPNMANRTCDVPKSAYYVPNMDSILIEAEVSVIDPTPSTPIVEVYELDGIPSTGNGFIELPYNEEIKFNYTHKKPDGHFYVALRYSYSPRRSGLEINVRVDAHQPQIKFCTEKTQNTRLDVRENQLYTLGYSSNCFEQWKNYTITLGGIYDENFYLDSIILFPDIDKVDVLKSKKYPIGSVPKRFRNYYCEQQILDLRERQQYGLSEDCKDMAYTIMAVVNDGADPCNCDSEGINKTNECEKLGGDCTCKKNVEGTKCDRCKKGYFNLAHPNGCQSCDCHAEGATGISCTRNGDCMCDKEKNITGQKCDRCIALHYRFPYCDPCECNNMADSCNNQTGECLCKSHTTGWNCDKCEKNYYNSLKPLGKVRCEACKCPGTPDSDSYFASGCEFLPNLGRAKCFCDIGYAGYACDECANGYYGRPKFGEKCKRCECNNNVDPESTKICDKENGTCFNCLYHTIGKNCELCKNGYYPNNKQLDGFSDMPPCLACNCNSFGTSKGDENNCVNDHSGQCRCLPNVVGRACDQCIDDKHWNFYSGKGCKPCDCDIKGSLDSACYSDSDFSGQCKCKLGRGGRKCDECENDYYGDPEADNCRECNCNPYGTEYSERNKLQPCNKTTGQCNCTIGITGMKCDMCARGTKGKAPSCEPCGECFDNWDRIISGLSDKTDNLIKNATSIKTEGTSGAFKTEFKYMDNVLLKIREIINSNNFTRKDYVEKLAMVKNINDSLQSVEMTFENLMKKVIPREQNLKSLEHENSETLQLFDKLSANDTKLNKEAQNLQEKVVKGAEESTKESLKKVRQAKEFLKAANVTRRLVIEEIDEAKSSIQSGSMYYDEKVAENKEKIDKLTEDVSLQENDFSNINRLICGVQVKDCDKTCGGIGCKKCGIEVSCANSTLEITNRATMSIEKFHKTAQEKRHLIKDAFEKTEKKKNSMDNLLSQIDKLTENIDDFMNNTKSTLIDVNEVLKNAKRMKESNHNQDDLRKILDDILTMSHVSNLNDVKNLSEAITKIASGLKNISKILEETESKKKKANDLLNKAKQASNLAKAVLKKVEDIERNLNTSTNLTAVIDDIITKNKQASKKGNSTFVNITKRMGKITLKLNKVRATAQIVRSNLDKQSNKNAINQQTLERSSSSIDDSTTSLQNMDISSLEKSVEETQVTHNKTLEMKKSQWTRLKKLLAQSEELLGEMKELPGKMVKMNTESMQLKMELTGKVKDLEENLKRVVVLQAEFSEINKKHERALSDAQGK